MATLSDVAARAGVSISAVSRVLRDAPSTRVSENTRQRIRQAAADLDYQPNFAGRALKSSRTRVAALVVPDLTNAIFTELMHGVEDAALASDYTILLGHSEGMQPGGDTIARMIGQSRVDGLLLHPGDDVAEKDLEALVHAKIPAVTIHTRHAQLSSVTLEDERAARMATQHLIELGHQRIGLINGVDRSATAVRRREGYVAALETAGIGLDPALLTAFGYEPEMGRVALRQLMSLASPPTGLVVSNLNAAIGALREARMLGLSVPADVSVVGIHDAWSAENTWPALTTVKLPLYELGVAAFEALERRLAGGQAEQVLVDAIPPQLVLRESTMPPPSGR